MNVEHVAVESTRLAGVSRLTKSLCLACALGFTGSLAVAQDDTEDSLEEIVVVGSSIGIRESDIESQALPIQYIGPEQLSMSGQYTVAEMLRQQPSFMGENEDDEGYGPTATLNLRGVGSQYTLTLVNGRRFGVNSITNIGMIPAAAVQHVEILKAGASALYGSDAVAGVVNIVLKDSYDGFGFETSHAANDVWDSQTYSVFFGGESDRSSFIMLADITRRAELAGIDRFPYVSNDRRPSGGFDSRSNFQNPGRVEFSDDRPDVILDYTQFGPGESSLDPDDYVPFDFETHAHDRAIPCNSGLSGTGCRGTTAMVPADKYSFMARGAYDLGEETTISGDFLYHRTEIEAIGGVSTFYVDVPAANPHNPFGEQVRVAYRPFPAPLDKVGGFNGENLDAFRGSLELQHRFSDRATFTGTVNGFRSEGLYYRPNAFLGSAIDEAVQSTDPDEALDLFCNRCNPASVWEGILHDREEDQVRQLGEVDLRLDGDLLELPGGTVRYATGIAWRAEDYSEVADQLTLTGAIHDSSGDDFALDRTVTSIFGEARIPLVAGSIGADRPRVEANVAFRYEDYSDFGGTFDPLVSLKADIIPGTLMVRGSWNSSFRAPYLEDLVGGAVDSDEEQFPDPELGGQIVDVRVEEGSNPDLEAEDGETFSIGLVATPEAVPGLFASLDYWRLTQDNVIIAPDPLSIFLGEIPGTVIRGEDIGPGGEDVIVQAFLTNFAERIAEGIDINLNYTTTLMNDIEMNLNLATTYLTRFEADLGDGQGLQEQAGTASGGFGALPDFRIMSGVALNYGPFTGRVDFSYMDSLDDPVYPPFTEPLTVDSVLYTDVTLRYTLEDDLAPLKDASIRVGVENVGDELPPFIRRFNYYSTSLHDIRGRFWSVSLSGRFGD